MKTYNNTTMPNIERLIESVLHPIKKGKNNWRKRNITLYEHPRDMRKVVSEGISFDGKLRIIAEESLNDWSRELSQSGNFVTN
jgi:hypothetical protein